MAKKTVLYLHVTTATKNWLKKLANEQVGRVSQSTMAEKVFFAAKQLGIFKTNKKEKTWQKQK